MLIDRDLQHLWFFVLDNASAHTTAAIETFAAEHRQRIELVYLRSYSPHLNRIDRLWHLMHSKVTRNRFYESLDAVAEEVHHLQHKCRSSWVRQNNCARRR